jgi:N-acetylmuramoyl-L-alanine amidase
MRFRIAAPSLLALLLCAPVEAQDRPLVVIDPGHGGDEVGVVAGDVLEKDLILEVAMSIGAEFVAAGYDVVFTRTRDVAVEWADRRALADESGAVALFMLHAMQSEDPADSGAEIYFDENTPASVALAEAVGAEFREMGSEVLLDPRPWPFLQSPSVPTAMIEAAHLTNPDEGARMADPAFHHEIGRALVAALEAVRGG